jgi:TetR/AcrR family transcriptional regulator, mexJK operon transcriptional repressor
LGKAFYEGGPRKAIGELATALQRWTVRGLLVLEEPMVAATDFNWLVLGEPINRAMFLGNAHLSAAEQQRHLVQCVRVFLAAYGRSQAPDWT